MRPETRGEGALLAAPPALREKQKHHLRVGHGVGGCLERPLGKLGACQYVRDY